MNNKDYPEVMQEFYYLYRKKMYYIAYQILRNSYDAEDAVQEAFIKLFKDMDVIKDPSSDRAKSYALTAIKSASIDIYRKKSREKGHTVLTDTIPEQSDSPDAADISGTADTVDATELIRKLPEHYRAVLDCRFIKELSVKKTAALLGIKETAVRKRQERGLKILRAKMGGESYGTYK